METFLTFDNKGKQLGVAFKQSLSTNGGLSLKAKGQINTNTGTLDHYAALSKYIYSKPSSNKHGFVDRDLKKRYRLGAGVSYKSGTEDLLAGISLKKGWPVANRRDAWLKMRANADYNTQTQKVEGRGSVVLQKTVLDFTDTQDLRLSVGYRARVNYLGDVTGEAFGQIRENNWSLNTDFKGYFGVRYDL